MYICYVDEAGCTGSLLAATSPVQPVFVICGLVVRQDQVAALTRDFLSLKKRFFPKLGPASGYFLHWILPEIKGAEVRRDAIDSSRNVRRAAIGFLDRLLDLVDAHVLQLDARVWVKGIGETIDGKAMYHSSIHFLCDSFNARLDRDGETGIVVCDGRNKGKNSALSFSIFTSKYRSIGDRSPRILEVPAFVHSENHAAVQIADLLVSALLWPMAVDAYCTGHINNAHVKAGYAALRTRYGARLGTLQGLGMHGKDAFGRRLGGIVVSDKIGQQSYRAMLSAPTAAPMIIHAGGGGGVG